MQDEDDDEESEEVPVKKPSTTKKTGSVRRWRIEETIYLAQEKLSYNEFSWN
jgi:hypothetical protein